MAKKAGREVSHFGASAVILVQCLTLLVLYPAYSLRQKPTVAELQSNLGISLRKACPERSRRGAKGAKVG